MRKLYRMALKQCFHKHLVITRAALDLTQSDMAEYLAMNDRSYIDLDHGKSTCSATTLALYLVYLCEDPNAFLEELKYGFEAEPVVRRKTVHLRRKASPQYPFQAPHIR